MLALSTWVCSCARCWEPGSHGSGRTGMPRFLFLFFGLLDGFPRLKNRKTLRFQSDDRRYIKIVAISVICCAIRTNGLLPRPAKGTGAMRETAEAEIAEGV